MKNIEKLNIKVNKNTLYIFNELYDNDNIRKKIFKINNYIKGEWFICKDGLMKKKEYLNIKLDDLPEALYNITDNGNINIKIKSIIINKGKHYYKVKTKYTINNKNKLFNSIINKIVKIKNKLYITRINKDNSIIDIKLKIRSLLPFNTILEKYVSTMCNKYIEEIIEYFLSG